MDTLIPRTCTCNLDHHFFGLYINSWTLWIITNTHGQKLRLKDERPLAPIAYYAIRLCVLSSKVFHCLRWFTLCIYLRPWSPAASSFF